MKPVKHKDSLSNEGPVEKPRDKDPHDYIASESVPPDLRREEALDESLMENHGDFSKKGWTGTPPAMGRP